ncbi:hypothetical protein A2U01_0040368 [Trifolium medium]|uniref:Uncharacterized protein n=1 Tax=Trifolium medium TaxID=97028 RepID=A0A392Q5M7_9FABA|nr:hypothetical protein [Trifolium medium]
MKQHHPVLYPRLARASEVAARQNRKATGFKRALASHGETQRECLARRAFKPASRTRRTGSSLSEQASLAKRANQFSSTLFRVST